MSKESDRPTSPTLGQRTFTRRGVLAVGASGLLVASIDAAAPHVLLAAPADAPTFELDFTRAADMVQLHFAFHNLELSKATTPPQLVRKEATQPAFIVVRFPSQHVMEQPVYESGDRPDPGKLKSEAVLDSKIAFRIPQTVKSLPYTEDGLFGWWQWVMNVVPAALPPGAKPRPAPGTNKAPGELETDLLLVDWIHLSPDRFSTWQHASEPVTHAGRTELWHTRLANRDDKGKPTDREGPTSLRAIYAEQPLAGTKYTVFADWHPEALVKHTSDFALEYVNHASTDLVLLSAAGSSLELAANWHHPAPLATWEHRSWLGRDNFVRVVARGYLFPFGHEAVVVEINERKLENGVAYLVQRSFIKVNQPVRTFPDDGTIAQPNGGREFPFTSLRLTTTVTPTLPQRDDRKKIANDPIVQSFWVTDVAGNDLPFPVVATTIDGRTVEFTSFLAFIFLDESGNDTRLASLVDSYGSFTGIDNPTKIDPRREIVLNGQELTFAPQRTPEEDTSFPVSRFYLGADRIDEVDEEQLKRQNIPNYWPTVLAARVRMLAVNALTGRQDEVFLGYDPKYVETDPAAFAENDNAGLYARVQGNAASLGRLRQHLKDGKAGNPSGYAPIRAKFDSADKVGGVATPNLNVAAVSRTDGPLSGSAEAISKLQSKGEFNPLDFFPREDIDTLLLGGISLGQILAFGNRTDGSTPPKIVRNPLDNGDIETVLDWNPRLLDDCESQFEPFNDNTPGNLELHVRSTLYRSSGRIEYTVTGELTDFTIHLASRKGPLAVLSIKFKEFVFSSDTTNPISASVKIDEVELGGALEWVNNLLKVIKVVNKKADSGFKIQLRPSSLLAGVDIEIPTIPLGVLNLQNIGFSMELELPFNGKEILFTFGFSSRDKPFLLTINALGGGGFFELEVDMKSIRRVEAGLYAGGAYGVNFAILSASVMAMIGFIFRLEWENRLRKVTLTGFVRISGRVSILGLITVSLEIYAGLTYDVQAGTVVGEVRVSVSVQIGFFSKSFQLRATFTFVGGSDDSNLALDAPGHEFGDLISQSDWNAYCDSFAAA